METAHQMKQRHKAELKALTESAGKKKKGSAKELKQKEDDLRKKHEEELSRLQGGPVSPDSVPDLTQEAQKLAVKEDEGDDDVVTGATESKAGSSESRSARKKKAKAAKEQERQAQVAAEVASMKNPRKEEKEKLEAQLKSLGLAVVDIRADGHCLYSSIADQLVATKHPAASQLVKRGDNWEPATTIRGIAAAYMIANQKNFIGFVTDDEGEPVTPAHYAQYCRNITEPDLVVWGGEPEIVALSKALGSPITVHAAASPPMVIGSEQLGTPLQISLHRFELSAGNHYNSVVKVKG
jgi:OTU domain-containing protein 6